MTLNEMIDEIKQDEKNMSKFEVVDFGKNSRAAIFYAAILTDRTDEIDHINILGASKIGVDSENGRMFEKHKLLSNEPEQVKIELIVAMQENVTNDLVKFYKKHRENDC